MPDRLEPHLSERISALSTQPPAGGGFVLYWMRLALRGHENPALDVAVMMAADLGVPLLVVHALSERYRYASDRHHTFILQGVRDVVAELADLGISLLTHVERPGHRVRWLPQLAAQASLVVTEDAPISPLREWTRTVAAQAKGPVWLVDTSNVVPGRLVPTGQNRAYKFRTATAELLQTRLKRRWPSLEPDLVAQSTRGAHEVALPFEPVDLVQADLADLVASCEIDHSVAPVPDTPGGARAGYARWEAFKRSRLRGYARNRNDPARAGVSRMSAYLHYGMVAPTRLAREAAAVGGPGADKYLDELIVWRELAHYWCRHHAVHNRVDALPAWAQQTLREHASDARQVLDLETLARAQTGDALWDACQRSLLKHGELHNNVRMTWAKAIPGWTRDPDDAVFALFDLNDRYALDGRDPSSVAGLMWSLGLLDRPFDPPTPVLGKVRSRPLARHTERVDLPAYEAVVDRPRSARLQRVAVVGAGLAGAMCARTLADHGLEVSLFDKGRGAGGRCSTRRAEAAAFDHGAPGFTITDKRVGRYARSWRAAGRIAKWDAVSGRLSAAGFAPEEGPARFVGVPAMNRTVKHLLEGLTVQFGTRIEQVRLDEIGVTLVDAQQSTHGVFDAVVVAVPAPQAVPLLEHVRELADAMANVEVAPCWAVMAELAEPGALATPFGLAHIGDGPLATVVRNHTKPGRPPRPAWVLQGTPAWSAAHLEDAPDEVGHALWEALCDLVQLPVPERLQAHRWRYARVVRPVGVPALIDAAGRVAVCGDALLGDGVEQALLSGMAAAGRLLGRSGP